MFIICGSKKKSMKKVKSRMRKRKGQGESAAGKGVFQKKGRLTGCRLRGERKDSQRGR